MVAFGMVRASVRSAVVFPAALLVLILFALALAIEAINQALDRRINKIFS